MRGLRDLVFVGAIVGGSLLIIGGAMRPAMTPRPSDTAGPASQSSLEQRGNPHGETIARLNALFGKSWTDQGLATAARADDWTIARRLSLALCGTIPSLEEIRRLQARPAESRLESWLDDLLADRRSSDYLAERFARAYVGTEDGPFLLFRRRRFTTWLSDAFLANRPYDAIVRDLIADKGLWTDHPATNFVSVTFDQEKQRPDPERLAARFSRCFLGARLDCAQCHDHPFDQWKQAEFRGLAAFFGGLHADLRGIRDGEIDYHPPNRKTQEPTDVSPAVPFEPELLPAQGEPRERLADWVVNPKNPSLARATVNRVWALLLGRPLSEPVDDLPSEGDLPEPLKLLAEDFVENGYDLHRLIRVITGCEAFRLSSATIEGDGPSEEQEQAWAAFPITRLRPEQVAGAIFQSSTVSTIRSDSFWLVRLATFTGSNDFIRRHGDTGEDEFNARGGTIPQRLLLLNGDLVAEKTRKELFNAVARIADQAPDDDAAVEVAYLTVLTRRPSPEEREHFRSKLKDSRGDARAERLGDLVWSLLNSSEFSWNH